MTLNRDDYPTLTDEQWEALTAEVDRARTQASATAATNAAKKAKQDAEAEKDAAIAAAIEAERAKLEADEQGKLEIERKEIADARAKLDADAKSLKARKMLVDAKLPDDKIDALLPLFTNVDEKALEGTVTTFITTYQDGVKAEVDVAKQELLGNATPPVSPTGAPVDMTAQAQDLLAKGDEVGAMDMLLKDAGLVPSAS